jgi:hypothetical protein
MANAPVLKTGVRKDLGVRIPRPPLLEPHTGFSAWYASPPARHTSRRSRIGDVRIEEPRPQIGDPSRRPRYQ